MKYDEGVSERSTQRSAKSTSRGGGSADKQAGTVRDSLPFAKKRLGQHWLTDNFTLEDIVDFANVSQLDTVLEVGPGMGTLTNHLSKKASKVVAVEYDDELALPLSAKYANTNVQVIPDDILQFDLTQLPKRYKVVANIPYYLTSNLLRVLLESKNPPSSLTLLVQKEVAERIAAKPGAMSVLSACVQFYCDVVLGRVVQAHLFSPPPKVDSQVIKLDYREHPLFKNINTDEYFMLVKAGFSERRKKLRTSLSRGLGLEKSKTEAMLKTAGINPDKRAQELSLKDWYAIYEAFKQI